MAPADTRELVTVQLANHRIPAEPTGPVPRAMTPAGIAGALGADDSLADRMALFSTLETLERDGLVESVRAPVEGAPEPRVAYRLTRAGRAHAEDRRDALAGREIVLQYASGDERRERITRDGRDAPDGPDRETVPGEPAQRGVDERNGTRTERVTVAEAARRLGVEPPAILSNLSERDVYHVGAGGEFESVLGRDSERARVRSVLEEVDETGAGRVLALTGPAGIGKTTLARTVTASLAEDLGCAVVRARADGSGEPYHAVGQLLSALEGAPDPFPTAGPAPDDPEDLRRHRNALFYEAAETLAADSDERPRVAVIDDLHLADGGTLSFLEYLLETIDEWRLLVLVALRPAAGRAGIPPALDPQRRDDRDALEVISLSALGRDATATLVERTVGRRGAPPDLVEAIHRHTGGVPLYVEEVTRALLDRRQLDPEYRWYPDDRGAIEVPAEVTGVIRERLETLDADALAMLEWAALVGERVPLEVLRAVGPDREGSQRALVEMLVDAGVFEWRDGETVAFRATVLRESLLETLPPDERTERHAAIAEALEGRVRESAEWAAIRAHHHAAAGSSGRAVEGYLTAAEGFLSSYAAEEAVTVLERAGDLARGRGSDVDEAGDGEHADRLVAIMERLGDAGRLVGDRERALECYELVERRASDPVARVRAHRKAAEVHRALGDPEAVQSAVDTGRHIADTVSEGSVGESPDSGMARQDGAGTGATDDGSTDRTGLDDRSTERTGFGEGLDREAHGELTAELVRLDCEHAAWLRERGRPGEALELLENLEGRLADVPTPERDRLRAQATKEIATLHLRSGAFERADRACREALAACEHADAASLEWRIRTNLGIALLRQGRLDEAEDEHRRAKSIAAELGDRWGVGLVTGNLGNLYSEMGRYGDAREAAREALEIARAVDDRMRRIIWLNNVGACYARDGAFEAANEHLTRAGELARSQEYPLMICASHANMAREVAIPKGSFDRARGLTDEALAVARDLGSEGAVAGVLGAAGRAEFAAGNLGEAIETLERARELDPTAVPVANDLLRARVAAGQLEGVDELVSTLLEEQPHRAPGLVEYFVATDDLERASEWAERGLALARDEPIRIYECEDRLAAARLAVARDEPAVAREHLERVSSVAADTGAEYYADRAERLGRETGVSE